MPTDRYPQDERLDRLDDYLLGRLSDAEADQLDELSIADEEFAWRLRAAENDLVDGYVRDTLAPDTRARFEAFYLASPRRRAKVAFARSLVNTTDRRAEQPADVAKASADAVLPANRRSSTTWWLLAAAAAVVVAAATMVVRNGDVGRPVDRPSTSIADHRPASQPTPAAVTPAPTTEVASVPTPSSTSSSSAASIVTTEAIALAPDTRAVGTVVSVKVPEAADRVAFDLQLEANEFPRYQATLKDPGTDRAIWRSGWVASGAKRDAPIVSVAVPARMLKTQHYTFELTGRNDANRTDLVASYVFEVVPR